MSYGRLRVAGVDTREARATATVRSCARTAAFVAGPGWLAAASAPVAWGRWWDAPGEVRPWFVVGLLLTGLGAAVVAWKRDPFGYEDTRRVLPVGADAAIVLLLFAFIVATPRDAALNATLVGFGPVLAGWVIGRAARLASDACVPEVRSAAAGIVTMWAMIGLGIAGHLALVLDGSGPGRASAWAVAYVVLGLVSLARAGRSIVPDRTRAAVRASSSGGQVPEDRRGSVLVADGIGVRFGSSRVLRGTSLTADAGEMVALVGGNGAGKSTLLRVVAGLLVSDAGRVYVDGEDITELLPEERAAAGLAFVSGARPVFPDLTVYENLRVSAFRTHITHRSFDAATEAVLELIPVLARRRDAKAGVLSGGEQRLLAVAQTLYRRPKVLLADELSLGLDADARVAVLDLLRMLATEGVCVVVVDHDLPALLPRCDRAALLAQGSITDFVPAGKVLEGRADLLPATFLAEAAR